LNTAKLKFGEVFSPRAIHRWREYLAVQGVIIDGRSPWFPHKKKKRTASFVLSTLIVSLKFSSHPVQ